MEQVLLSQNGSDILITSTNYKNELELQEIIKKNPSLINLSSIFESPLMIIGREQEHIDVLAITSDAVPVIIECKRRDNPDMRYLIAQMFEYASKLSEKSYNEFDQMVTRYFSSNHCQEEKFKTDSLQSAFKKFIHNLDDYDHESYDEAKFKEELSDKLKNGEFYLLVIVDEISDTALRTIDFLNDKLNKLRIEIVEVSKFSRNDANIFVPRHINREIQITQKPRPGKITFEEMLNKSGTKEAEYLREFKETWIDDSDKFTIRMGTAAFSALYKNIPIFYVHIDKIRIAPRIKRQHEVHFEPLSKMFKQHFSAVSKTSVRFDAPKFNDVSFRSFINQAKKFCIASIKDS